MSSPSPSASSTASPPPPPQPDPESMVQEESTPIPVEVVEGVANLDQNADTKLESTPVFGAPSGGDGDSESFWDIIAESHPNLESYGDHNYDHEISEPMTGFPPQMSSSAVAAELTSSCNDYQPAVNTSLGPLMINSHPSYSTFSPPPSHTVTFEKRQDGTPFPLSKPIVREDGLLLVGTEFLMDPSTQTGEKNRIFVANFLRPDMEQPASHFQVEQEVRDLQWVDAQTAIVAIGKEIQLIQLGDATIGGSCRVQDPINTVHSETIREIAVSPSTSSHVLSGSFDGTVVVTDLGDRGDPKASSVIGKFDAHDVVSSVRWSPDSRSQLSWTTDGGDFQVADARAPSPQLQVPLYTFLNVDKLGGLFAHEYLCNFNIALGFQHGFVAFVDIRKPRQSSCTSLIESKLAAVGEIQRSPSNNFALFGHGGFSSANPNGTADSLEQITLRQQPNEISTSPYKTSGDFSHGRGAYLAVSDSQGIVSVYSDDSVFGSSAAFRNY